MFEFYLFIKDFLSVTFQAVPMLSIVLLDLGVIRLKKYSLNMVSNT